MSEEELILYEAKGKIATITLNRPAKANAFNYPMLKQMHDSLIRADQDESVRCIIIKSASDKFFSAGYDLKAVMGSREEMKSIIEWGRKVNETILFMKKTVIVQVKGIAVGDGVLLIMAADLRIFADRPKEELYLKLPEIEISAFPQTGATILTLMAFGFSYAKHLLLTSEKVGVQELKNINFMSKIVPFDKIDEETMALGKQIAKCQKEFLFMGKVMLTIMGKRYAKKMFDLEDECALFAYGGKKSMKEADDFIEGLYKKYT